MERRPIGLVWCGFGSAERPTQMWRNVTRALRMKTAKKTVNFYLGDEVVDGTFTPTDDKDSDLRELVEEVLALYDEK